MTSQNQLPEVGEPSQWLCAEEMYAHLRSRSAPYLRRLQHEFPQPGMRQLARSTSGTTFGQIQPWRN